MLAVFVALAQCKGLAVALAWLQAHLSEVKLHKTDKKLDLPLLDFRNTYNT